MNTKKTHTSEVITTKIDFAFHRIARLSSIAELAEMCFPGNRNQQYAFLVIWVRLKWRSEGIVPDLGQLVMSEDVSRRTFERVRAKMRRMGLLEHITRFDPRFGNREGWILSDNFEKSLSVLSQRISDFRKPDQSSEADDQHVLAATRELRDAGQATRV
jgi:hypothetical protein